MDRIVGAGEENILDWAQPWEGHLEEEGNNETVASSPWHSRLPSGMEQEMGWRVEEQWVGPSTAKDRSAQSVPSLRDLLLGF